MTQANASQTGNGAAAAAPASSAAEPSALDAALKEFESANAQPVHTLAKVVQPIVKYVEGEMIAKENVRIDSAVSDAIKFVKTLGKFDDVPDEIIEGQLHKLAAKNPDFSKAWGNREDSPDTWTSKLKDVAVPQVAEAVKKWAAPNSVRTDIEAAVAAVQGTSHSPASNADQPSPTAMFQMNDRDWENYKARLSAG